MIGHLPRTVRVLGVSVHPVDRDAMLAWVREAAAGGRCRILANHNLHSIALHHRDPGMRAFYAEADLVVADGRPVTRWGALMGRRLRDRHKLSWLDHLDDLLALAVREGWPVAHVGGRPGVAERAAQRLRDRHPGLRLAVHHGFFAFPGPEADAVVAWLQRERPRLLLVGMGMPRQEHWLLAERARLPAGVAVTCGATFDYLAGAIPLSPRWLSPLGAEWLFRLACEPRRLWRRYLLEPFALAPWALRDWRAAIGGREPRIRGGTSSRAAGPGAAAGAARVPAAGASPRA